MKIKPNKNYHSLGTNIMLNKNLTYNGIIATNQPNYKKEGLIFVNEILLNKKEYKITK